MLKETSLFVDYAAVCGCIMVIGNFVMFAFYVAD